MVPLVANVAAEKVTDPDTIRAYLIDQVTAMVRWRESVLYMKERGIDTLIEVGAGKVLSGLARPDNTFPAPTSISVSIPRSFI